MRSAMQYGKVPAGKQLVFESANYGLDCSIRMVDAPAWTTVPPEPVPIQAALRRPHAAVLALQASGSPLELERPVRHRALLLIQSLVVEAERRSYTVTVPKLIREP